MGTRERKSRGQSLVEMALVLPIIVLVVLGLIEFGRALFVYTVVSNAAREGARFGIVHPKDISGIENAVHSRLVLVPTSTVVIETYYDDGVTRFDDPNQIVEGQSRVVVNVSHDFSMITPIIRQIFPPTTMKFTSARTIVSGTRARKTPVPPPTLPPGAFTYTPVVATDTPTPTPTPQALIVQFVSGYPCRGQEQNVNKGQIRVKARVTDWGGVPVTDALVTVNIEGATLTHLGGGIYGGPGGDCWASASDGYGDQNVTVTASRAGYYNDSDTQDTSANPICDGGCAASVPATMTPTPTPSQTPTPTSTPTQTPTPSQTPTPGTPTATPTNTVPPTATSTSTATATPTMTPTPQALIVQFVGNYPCRGEEQNANRGYIRVQVRVTDQSGTPVAGATVNVQIGGGESATLTDLGNGYYGGPGGSCWASADIYFDSDVTVSATKVGYYAGSTGPVSTSGNPTCTGACP